MDRTPDDASASTTTDASDGSSPRDPKTAALVRLVEILRAKNDRLERELRSARDQNASLQKTARFYQRQLRSARHEPSPWRTR